MSKVLTLVAAVATAVAGLGSMACALIFIDEPTMPRSMIK